MIVIQIGIAGDRPCGWACKVRRDDEQEEVYRGCVQATHNQTLLYVANNVFERMKVIKPADCGRIGNDGANIIIQASQLYLINGMTGRDDGKANRVLWDVLLETNRKRTSEGFVVQWQHIPATENPMREPASAAAKECTPTSLSSPKVAVEKRAPWEEE